MDIHELIEKLMVIKDETKWAEPYPEVKILFDKTYDIDQIYFDGEEGIMIEVTQ